MASGLPPQTLFEAVLLLNVFLAFVPCFTSFCYVRQTKLVSCQLIERTINYLIVSNRIVSYRRTLRTSPASDGPSLIRFVVETAKIIPATYGPWRHDKKYNPYEDIRKNLYDHYGNRSSYHGPSYV